MFEETLEAGASDVESSNSGHEVTCDPDDFSAVRDALEAKFGAAEDARLDWKSQTTVPVDEAVAGTLDGNETPEECARRETREETGYHIRLSRHFKQTNQSMLLSD